MCCEVFLNEKQLLPEVCSRVCFCQNIWCMRHTVCFQERNFLWCKQTQLFKYFVNSAILFFKSFWTRFIRLTSWHILCCTWCPRGPSSLLKMLVLPRKVFQNWDFGGWIALWCEMHIFQRCRHRQTDLVIRPSKSIVQEPIFQIGGRDLWYAPKSFHE